MRLDRLLAWRHVALKLDIEPVGEKRREPVEPGGGEIALPGCDRPVDRTAWTAGESDQPIGSGFQRRHREMGRSPGVVSMNDEETRRTRFQ